MPLLVQCQRQIDRGGRLANSAFTRGYADYMFYVFEFIHVSGLSKMGLIKVD
jgi:hypothetical protein